MEAVDFLSTNANVGTANISDVQGSSGVMHGSIKPANPASRMVGPAFTVRAFPGSIRTVHWAMSQAPQGSVLVVAGEGDVDAGALLGELMALECAERGFAGVVVDGAVRDTDTLRTSDFPVFARGSTPRVGTNARLGVLDVPVSCAGVVVEPGDLIIGDVDGVIAVPRAQIAEVPSKVEKLLAKEEDLAAGVKRGDSIARMLGFADAWQGQS